MKLPNKFIIPQNAGEFIYTKVSSDYYQKSMKYEVITVHIKEIKELASRNPYVYKCIMTALWEEQLNELIKETI